jgi:rhodanese-related sulfurtransferase
MKEISPAELKAKLDSGEDLQVIDIREPHEYDSGNIGADHIPMGQVMDRLDEIKRDRPVVIHCKSGKRATAMIHSLETQESFENILHLKGGILAWKEQIDKDITVY